MARLLTQIIFCVLLMFKPALADLQAARITHANAAELIQGGPDAIGGIDDWFISNGTVCAVFSHVTHESDLSINGGVLVDFGFCDRPDDQYVSAQDLLDGKRNRPININQINVVKSNDNVSVITHGSTEDVILETRYTLNKSSPTKMTITKRFTRHTDTGPGFNFITPITFNYHSLTPFVFSSTEPTKSNGFQNEDFVSRGVTSLKTAARNADTIIMVSPPDSEHPISYGWQLNSATRISQNKQYKVPHYALADDVSTAMLVLTDDFTIGSGDKLGLLQLPQLKLMSLDAGDILELNETLYVGRKSDVASITDQTFKDGSTVSGQINEPNSALHLLTTDGNPVTHIRPKSDGTFTFRAPNGQYNLQINGSAERKVTQSIEITQIKTDLGKILLPKPATLKLPSGHAMRLVFVGINGTHSPNFVDNLTGATVLDADGLHNQPKVSHVFLAGVESDIKSVDLATGSYQVYATRGPEFSLEQTEITLADGEQADLNIAPPNRVIQTPGYIASDLHVHSGLSMDNAFSQYERVRSFVAEYGEIMVASEHDRPIDFTPLISEMGVSDQIVSITGVEMTSVVPTARLPYTGGHANFFPIKPHEHTYREGMFPHENRRLREIIYDAHQVNPDTIVQLNHPRDSAALSGKLPKDYHDLIDKGSYLEHMGTAGHPYDPSSPLHSHPNATLINPDPTTGIRDLDIDAIELINPHGTNNQERVEAVRRDWISLLLQGERITGTANSDSHNAHNQVALPRTMVAMQKDKINAFDLSEFVASLRNGNAYGTTGPMINLSLDTKKMGDTLQGNKATLRLSVASAKWIPISQISVQVNGSEVVNLDASIERVFNVPLEFTKDSFVTIEVSGPISPEYTAIYAGLKPYAFSNPIYVDYDSDGQWVAPGL